MVRTDSREQKLDAFLKPANQSKAGDDSSNQRQGSSSGVIQVSPTTANQQRPDFKELPMEIDGEEKTVDANNKHR